MYSKDMCIVLVKRLAPPVAHIWWHNMAPEGRSNLNFSVIPVTAFLARPGLFQIGPQEVCELLFHHGRAKLSATTVHVLVICTMYVSILTILSERLMHMTSWSWIMDAGLLQAYSTKYSLLRTNTVGTAIHKVQSTSKDWMEKAAKDQVRWPRYWTTKPWHIQQNRHHEKVASMSLSNCTTVPNGTADDGPYNLLYFCKRDV